MFSLAGTSPMAFSGLIPDKSSVKSVRIFSLIRCYTDFLRFSWVPPPNQIILFEKPLKNCFLKILF